LQLIRQKHQHCQKNDAVFELAYLPVLALVVALIAVVVVVVVVVLVVVAEYVAGFSNKME
jgi:uncharacterized membrane protein YidH (DUF202 family)